MFNYISSFRQEVMLEVGLSKSEYFLLSWYYNYRKAAEDPKKPKVKMKEKDIDGRKYYWIHISKIVEVLPWIFGTTRSVERAIKGLTEKHIFDKKVVQHKGGTAVYFDYGDAYKFLDSKTELPENWKNEIAVFSKKRAPDKNDVCCNPPDKNVGCNNKGNKIIYKYIIGDSLANRQESQMTFNKNSLLGNDIPGLNNESLLLIKKLYKIFGVGTSRLPTSPETKKVTKVVKDLISVFNAIRSGTFLETYPIDRDWIRDGRIDLTPVQKEYTDWQVFENIIIRSAKRYVKSTPQVKRVQTVKAFLYNEYGAGGEKIPAYSLFLKYCMKKHVPETQVKISQIKRNLSEKVITIAEKYYNDLTAKFNQDFTEKEKGRFWNGVVRLGKWLEENYELLHAQNADGSFGTHFGGHSSFLTTLFTWLDDEGGAWGKLYPDIIQLDGEQWGQFCGYCRRKLGVELAFGQQSYLAMERAYQESHQLRKEYWKEKWDDKLSELTWEIVEATGKEYDDCEKEAEDRLQSQRFTEDLEFDQKWENRLAALRKRLNG